MFARKGRTKFEENTATDVYKSDITRDLILQTGVTKFLEQKQKRNRGTKNVVE